MVVADVDIGNTSVLLIHVAVDEPPPDRTPSSMVAR
jgi:hypothetical protein